MCSIKGKCRLLNYFSFSRLINDLESLHLILHNKEVFFAVAPHPSCCLHYITQGIAYTYTVRVTAQKSQSREFCQVLEQSKSTFSKKDFSLCPIVHLNLWLRLLYFPCYYYVIIKQHKQERLGESRLCEPF